MVSQIDGYVQLVFSTCGLEQRGVGRSSLQSCSPTAGQSAKGGGHGGGTLCVLPASRLQAEVSRMIHVHSESEPNKSACLTGAAGVPFVQVPWGSEGHLRGPPAHPVSWGWGLAFGPRAA